MLIVLICVVFLMKPKGFTHEAHASDHIKSTHYPLCKTPPLRAIIRICFHTLNTRNMSLGIKLLPESGGTVSFESLTQRF